METSQILLTQVSEIIARDVEMHRFVARVFLCNNLNIYYSLIKLLETKADVVVRISDFCQGEDSVPNLKNIISFLDNNKEKNVLLPHLGEYLRMGELTERNIGAIYSILNRQVHSTKRVWMPIFSAKGLFESIVGELSEERFGNTIFEIDDEVKPLNVKVFSNEFSSQFNKIVLGMKNWFRLWDEKSIKSDMSFSTKNITQMHPSKGDYNLSIIKDAFSYVSSLISDGKLILKQGMGTQDQWASLIPFLKEKSNNINDVILMALNQQEFNPYELFGNWDNIASNKKWAFILWYKLGLNERKGYISDLMKNVSNADDVKHEVVNSVFDYLDNQELENVLKERKRALDVFNISEYGPEFWNKLSSVTSLRTKLKILTSNTIEERTAIIEIVSEILRKTGYIDEYEELLKTKFSDLYLYLTSEKYVNKDTAEYIHAYKINKIADNFNIQISQKASDLDIYKFNSRGQILFSLKKQKNAYFLWIDGMGIEWIDLLISKVKQLMPDLMPIEVLVGTAAIPTVTSVNMSKADPSTISRKKFDALDALSHFKDKSDLKYSTIIAKQFEMIEQIARLICSESQEHLQSEIIVTADHGMSRLAAKAFHEMEGINPPHNSRVFNHGRYCEVDPGKEKLSIVNTIKDGNVFAFKTYNHFTVPGYAPGELHGGASPEEILVPIICFKMSTQLKSKIAEKSYTLVSNELYVDKDDSVKLSIKTSGNVKTLSVVFENNKIKANALSKDLWQVSLYGLQSGKQYKVRILLDNIFDQAEEIIYVKRKGIVIDDDFSF